MKHASAFDGLHSLKALLISAVLFVSSCSGGTVIALKSTIILVGSTPADAEIRAPLAIDAEKAIDFIRWELVMEQPDRYYVKLNFGEGEPNTRGFKGGGETRILRGTYTVTKDARGDIYRFTDENVRGSISLVKLNENFFHLLTADGKLMIGNGGWGYSLARKAKATTKSELVSRSTSLLDGGESETVFDGRTPCVDLGRADLQFTDGCLKLKWRITLRRDRRTNRPSSYLLESTLNRRQSVEGKWGLVNGTHANPRALILQLDPDIADKTVSFLVGDENVIFFLNKEQQLLAGNEDFGFGLSRRQPKAVKE
jgi:hypothetical protein